MTFCGRVKPPRLIDARLARLSIHLLSVGFVLRAFVPEERGCLENLVNCGCPQTPHSVFDGKFHSASLLFLIRPLTLNLTSDLLDSPYLLYRRPLSESEEEERERYNKRRIDRDGVK